MSLPVSGVPIPGPQPNQRAQKRYQMAVRRSEVARLLDLEWSQVAIAHELHVNPATISEDVKWLKAQWHERAYESFECFMAKQISRLDALYAKSQESFNASKKDGEETDVTQMAMAKKSAGGKWEPQDAHVIEQRQHFKKNHAGDPVWIGMGISVIREQNRMLGVGVTARREAGGEDAPIGGAVLTDNVYVLLPEKDGTLSLPAHLRPGGGVGPSTLPVAPSEEAGAGSGGGPGVEVIEAVTLEVPASQDAEKLIVAGRVIAGKMKKKLKRRIRKYARRKPKAGNGDAGQGGGAGAGGGHGAGDSPAADAGNGAIGVQAGAEDTAGGTDAAPA